MLWIPVPVRDLRLPARAVCPIGLQEVFASLEAAAAIYPDFRSWFFGKVVPGIPQGERKIFVARADRKILGVAIAKRSTSERKLCTLWVAKSARGRGIAGDLAESAFEWLGTSKPHFSVPEERLAEFRTLLARWDFSLSQSQHGYYRATATEFMFNGTSRPKFSS